MVGEIEPQGEVNRLLRLTTAPRGVIPDGWIFELIHSAKKETGVYMPMVVSAGWAGLGRLGGCGGWSRLQVCCAV